MSNVKAQIPNKIQNANVKKFFDVWSIVIDLTFACLPVGRDFEIWHS